MHSYTAEEDQLLIRLASKHQVEQPNSGRTVVSWDKVHGEYNSHTSRKKSKSQLRNRYRRLTGALPMKDVDRVLNAINTLERYDEGITDEYALEQLVQPRFPDAKLPEFKWEEFYEVADRLSELENKAAPTINSAVVHLPTDKPIALMHTADWHLCSRWMAYKTFRALLDLTLSVDRIYWATYGDEIDNFPMKWLPPAAQQVLTPKIQRRILRAIVERMTEKGKILWSFWGNHSFEERDIGENLTEPIWMGKIPYFHGKGVIRLRIGKDFDTAEEYVIFGAHGFKGNSIYNPNHPQMRALLWEVPQADFVVMGDRHKYAYQEVPHHENAYLAGLNQNRIAHLVQIGTAKSGPDHYTIRGWSQGHFEWPIFVLYPGEHKIKRVYEFGDLEHFLGIEIDKRLLKQLKDAAEAEGVT